MQKKQQQQADQSSQNIMATILTSIPKDANVTKIDYDSKNMKITNNKLVDSYIKEPVRDGWSYGDRLF
mgnify:CR=1 FL=1